MKRSVIISIILAILMTIPVFATNINKGETGNKNYKAGWDLNQYKIAYDLNGGALSSGKTNPGTYSVLSETFTLNNPEKAGCTFLGWTGSNGNVPEKTLKITKGSTGDRSYKASFEINSYKLIFDANGGLKAPEAKTVKYKEKYGKLDSPTPYNKEGYTVTFNGWYTEKEGGSLVSEETIMDMSDVTVYAHYSEKINSYKLIFDANGGSNAPVAKELEYGQKYGNLPEPTAYAKDGYTVKFNGWYDTKTGGNRVSDETTIGAQNITIYAHWEEEVITYNLTLKAQEGTINGKSSEVIKLQKGDVYTLSDASDDTLYFSGWYDDAISGSKVKTKYIMPEKDTTLYARFETVKMEVFNSGVDMDINYVDDEGVNRTLNYRQDTSSKETIELKPGTEIKGTFVLDDHSNSCYNSDYKMFKTEVEDIGTSSYGKGFKIKVPEIKDINNPKALISPYVTSSGQIHLMLAMDAVGDLYSLWKKGNTFILEGCIEAKFYDNMAKKTVSTKLIKNGETFGTLPAVTTSSGKTGYTVTLKEWTYNGQTVTESTIMNSNKMSINITTVWEEKPASYKVTFDANGGQIDSALNYQYYTYGNKYSSMATASRTYYNFNGWWTAPSGGSIVRETDIVNLTQDTILYAQWREIAHLYILGNSGSVNRIEILGNQDTTYTSDFLNKRIALPIRADHRGGCTIRIWHTKPHWKYDKANMKVGETTVTYNNKSYCDILVTNTASGEGCISLRSVDSNYDKIGIEYDSGWIAEASDKGWITFH